MRKYSEQPKIGWSTVLNTGELEERNLAGKTEGGGLYQVPFLIEKVAL